MTGGIEIFVYKLDKIIDQLEKIAVPKSVWRFLIDKIFWLIVTILILFTILFSVWIIWNPQGREHRFRYRGNNQVTFWLMGSKSTDVSKTNDS